MAPPSWNTRPELETELAALSRAVAALNADGQPRAFLERAFIKEGARILTATPEDLREWVRRTLQQIGERHGLSMDGPTPAASSNVISLRKRLARVKR